MLELLGGPKSATDYSREITVREVTLATGRVRSWSLGTDFAARTLQLAPIPSQPPAAYLLGSYGVPDIGIYTFLRAGPKRISGAMSDSPGLMAPDQTVFGGDRQYLTRISLDGVILERWPLVIPLPGRYSGPGGKGAPDGRTVYGGNIALDSAGDPFELATNGVNAVLADLKRGRQTALPGLGFARAFEIRADGMGFALATSYVLATDPKPCPFCAFREMDSLVEFDARTLQLTATYQLPSPRGRLLIGEHTVDVIVGSETSSTLFTFDERHGTIGEHVIPVIGWGLYPAADWAGNIYLVSHPFNQQDVRLASGPRLPAFQDRVMVYNRATGKTSDAIGPLRPPAGEEVLGLLFRT